MKAGQKPRKSPAKLRGATAFLPQRRVRKHGSEVKNPKKLEQIIRSYESVEKI